MTDTKPEIIQASGPAPETEGAKPRKAPAKPRLSLKAKAAGLAAVSLARAAVPGVVGAPARGLVNVATEGPAMLYTTQKDDIFYIDGGKKHYDPAERAWVFEGTIIPDDGTHPGEVRFIVKDTPMHEAWSRAAKKTGFDPGAVA